VVVVVVDKSNLTPNPGFGSGSLQLGTGACGEWTKKNSKPKVIVIEIENGTPVVGRPMAHDP
jgi:hypothetical protein